MKHKLVNTCGIGNFKRIGMGGMGVLIIVLIGLTAGTLTRAPGLRAQQQESRKATKKVTSPGTWSRGSERVIARPPVEHGVRMEARREP
jgi:hypothetical protein